MGGGGVLLAGIYGLAVYNLRYLKIGRDTLKPALILAVASGILVAAYTTYDAYGIRTSGDPLSFLAWFFMIDGLFFMPAIAAFHWRKMPTRPDLAPLMLRGLTGGVIAYFSFGGIILATMLDNVGQAAVLRENSVVFAAVTSWVLLKERVTFLHLALMALIALGAVIVGVNG